MTHFTVFEDDWVERFLPLTGTRPIFALRCGIHTLLEGIEGDLPGPVVSVLVRPFLTDLVREGGGLSVNEVPKGGSCVLVNGRLLGASELVTALAADEEPRLFMSRERELLAARLPADQVVADGESRWPVAQNAAPVTVVDWPRLSWPWEIVQRNPGLIAIHAAAFPLGDGAVGRREVTCLDEQQIFVDSSASIEPGVVLDARLGPIVIDEGAVVMANSVLRGPLYIGRGTRVKVGAKIYEGTTIGPGCKVGGEVEGSVFLGWSNKQHDGFLGHSIVGEWCNLGADTNNSDLKNNYSTVRVWCEGEWLDTGSRFVGLTMGDHTKTGINTTFNTGTVVGIACNVFGTRVPPKYIPDFTWHSEEGSVTHRYYEALKTAERVMGRRGRTLSAAQRGVLRVVFKGSR